MGFISDGFRMPGENAFVTIDELSTALGLHPRTIERSINTLQSQNKIRRRGPDRGGHWEVVD